MHSSIGDWRLIRWSLPGTGLRRGLVFSWAWQRNLAGKISTDWRRGIGRRLRRCRIAKYDEEHQCRNNSIQVSGHPVVSLIRVHCRLEVVDHDR